jgi:hypothetical protein
MARIFISRKRSERIGAYLFVVVALTLLIFIWWSAGSVKSSQEREEMKITKDAVIRATVECYALESRYPPGLDYLEENYDLALDHDKYIIHYQVIGENIMPDIKLFRVEADRG